MGSRVPKAAFPTARFAGGRWVVLMDDPLWDRFCKEVPASANERLTVKLRHLAEHGEDDMPRPRLRIEADPQHPGVAIASVEARGTILRGQVSTVEGRRHLFARSITIDPIEERPATVRRSRRVHDDRQGDLSF